MYDFGMRDKEMLESCNHVINQVEKWQEYICSTLAYCREVIDAGIVPAEDLEMTVSVLDTYYHFSGEILDSISDYIIHFKANGNDYPKLKDSISQGRNLLCTIKNRKFFVGKSQEYEHFEGAIRDGEKRISYWFSQGLLNGKNALNCSDQALQIMYMDVFNLLDQLKYILQKYIHEMEQFDKMLTDMFPCT